MRLAIVANPAGGRGRGAKALAMLREAFPAAQVLETSGPGDAEKLARECADFDVVAAVGGDGTIGDVANGLRGGSAALACVPGGTGNDLCRTLGIDASVPKAIEAIRAGKTQPMDAGECGGRLFIDTMSCGFDACVGVRVNRGYRWLGGTAAYVAALLQELAGYRAREVTVTVDGKRFDHRAMLVAVANAQSYGGGMRIAPQASLNDGLLDVVVVSEVSKLEFLRAFPSVFKGAHLGHPAVFAYRGEAVAIDAPAETPVLLDGELHTPGAFAAAAVPGVLRVIVP